MTVSIRQVLATLPTGEMGVPLTWDEVGRYLRENCNTDADRERENRHRLRDDLYRDGGVDHLCKVLEEVYDHEEIKKLRKKWAKFARFNNAIKRIVNEVSTVYTAPATRHVGNEADDKRYQEVLEALQFDEQLQEASRLFNLHRTIAIGPRVRILPDGTPEPVLDIVTPSVWRVVLHPNDNKLVIGHLTRTDFRSVRSDWVRPAAWVLWTDHEYVFLDEDMMPLASTAVEHELGVCRWVAVTRSPTVAGFWPGEEGEDLVAAHISIWFANILLLKETKSATKVPVATGDLSGMTRGQMLDSEGDISMPGDTGLQVHDMSMDPDQFTAPADHVLERCANNYGLSMALITHQGVQSAEARDAMRIPLRELRRAQQPMWRSTERRLAVVLAAVLAADASGMAFNAEGWRIDFGEAQTPLSENEEVELFLKKRKALLTNTVDYLKEQNPDLDDETAWALVLRNLGFETARVEEMRTLTAISGGASEDLEDPGSAEGDEFGWVGEVLDADE